MSLETITTLIPNTIMQKYYSDVTGEFRTYRISPVEGYVIHDNMLDTPVFDEFSGEETGEVLKGYTGGTISVGYNYDFEANPREIYAVPRDSVDENYIFGGGTEPDHEVM